INLNWCGSLSFEVIAGWASTCRTLSATSSPKGTRRPSGAMRKPPSAFSCSAGSPRRAAAKPARISRACAAACRMAVPLSCMDWLPDVYPSFAVRSVSDVTRLSASMAAPSCSAATCRRAVLMPCPSSHLPVQTVTRPSASMPIQESSSGADLRLPGSGGGEAGDGACEKARGPIAKLTTNAPAPASRSRRDIRGCDVTSMLSFSSPVVSSRCRGRPHVPRGSQYGLHDAHLRATAAQVRLQVPADLQFRWVLIGVEERLRAQHHAGNAEPTLCGLLLDESALQGPRSFGTTKPLQC